MCAKIRHCEKWSCVRKNCLPRISTKCDTGKKNGARGDLLVSRSRSYNPKNTHIDTKMHCFLSHDFRTLHVWKKCCSNEGLVTICMCLVRFAF